jgi:hypothetical protein
VERRDNNNPRVALSEVESVGSGKSQAVYNP